MKTLFTSSVLALLLAIVPSIGSAQLTITPITWDIVGLDSNSPTAGPDTFPVGVRIHNTSTDETNTNVTVQFTWDDMTFTTSFSWETP